MPTLLWSVWFRVIVGIVLFIFALYVSAYLGIYQEIVFAEYGKHATEALYFNVRLSLIYIEMFR